MAFSASVATTGVSMKPRAHVLWSRALAVWLLIALVESVHGTLREWYVTPRIGELAARRVGFVVGSMLVIGVAWLTSRWLGAATRAAQLKVGLLWLALMLAFEVGLGRTRGFSWQRIGADYDLSQGGLMLFGLLLMGLAPLLGAWLRALQMRDCGASSRPQK
jgi:hypothetical protein